MTNRCSAYLAALEAEAATYQLLAVGNCVTEVCKTHSYFDAAMEADELCSEADKLRATFPGVRYLVVLDPRGKQVSSWFEVPGAVESKPEAPAEDPAITLGEFVLILCWLLIGVAVGLWLRPML